MLIGQHCSCILKRCAFWSTPPHPPPVSDRLICLANMFCLFVSCGALFNFIQQPRNPFFIDCGIIRQLNSWLFNWVFGVDWGVVATCPAPLERVWSVKTGQTSLRRFVSALEEIIRICEEYACDSVKSCSCRGAAALLDRRRKNTGKPIH